MSLGGEEGPEDVGQVLRRDAFSLVGTVMRTVSSSFCCKVTRMTPGLSID